MLPKIAPPHQLSSLLLRTEQLSLSNFSAEENSTYDAPPPTLMLLSYNYSSKILTNPSIGAVMKDASLPIRCDQGPADSQSYMCKLPMARLRLNLTQS